MAASWHILGQLWWLEPDKICLKRVLQKEPCATVTAGSTASQQKHPVPEQPARLAKAGRVPAGLIPGGHVVVAIRTRVVDHSALLIGENNWIVSHECPSTPPALGFMMSWFWEPILQLGTDIPAEVSVFYFPSGKVLALKLLAVALFPEEAESMHGFVGL